VNWEVAGAIAEVVGATGVIVTLVYLALQIKDSNRVARAQSRQSITEFINQIALIRITHADRMSQIAVSDSLSAADEEFLTWVHIQVLLLAETYHYHHSLGLMPASHWHPFVNFFRGYSTAKGFASVWETFENSFAEEFQDWLNYEIHEKK
jgi:hypothetical protein